MTAIRNGQTETCNYHKYSHQPVSPSQHHAALPFLKVCFSSCGKAMASTSSNKSHLRYEQVWLVVGPNQHQLNRKPCRTRTCATTGQMQTAYLGPGQVCLAHPLELQPSAVAGTKTCQNGALSKSPTGTASAEQGNRYQAPMAYTRPDIFGTASPPCRLIHQCQRKVKNRVRLCHK